MYDVKTMSKLLLSMILKTPSHSTLCQAPQEICGPSGCVFVAGPRECYDKVMTIVTDVPLETCYLNPSRKCKLSCYIIFLNPSLPPKLDLELKKIVIGAISHFQNII